jgi:perosamine synthetase
MSEAPKAEAFLPLSVPVIAGREWEYVKDCLDTGWVSSAGAYVERFEERLCALLGADHAVAVVNGTAGLHLALLAAGVRPGDRVIVPTLTFIATANAVRHAGAEPVFVDCDEYMNIDVDGVLTYLTEACDEGPEGWLERTSGAPVKAVLPVHVYGRPARLAELAPLAARFGLALIEDATEALGSTWTAGPCAGRAAATVGQSGVLSFNGNKIATCGGGGAYITNDDDAAARVRHLSTQAKTDTRRFVHDETAWNYRLTNVAAAIGLAQLEQLEGFIAAKRAGHALYAELLADLPGIELIGVQDGTQPNFWFHSILVDESAFGRDRESLMTFLGERGIETRPVWGLLHEQAPLRGCTAWRIERARWFWQRVLNLPCSSDLGAADIARVAAAISAARGTA